MLHINEPFYSGNDFPLFYYYTHNFDKYTMKHKKCSIVSIFQ